MKELSLKWILQIIDKFNRSKTIETRMYLWSLSYIRRSSSCLRSLNFAALFSISFRDSSLISVAWDWSASSLISIGCKAAATFNHEHHRLTYKIENSKYKKKITDQFFLEKKEKKYAHN